MVAPIEALLSPKGGGVWTPECTQAANDIVKVIFTQVDLHQADAYGEFKVYPCVENGLGFIAVTQQQEGRDLPVAFLSRYLTATECKWSHLETVAALVSWGVRKLRRYTSTASKI